MSNIFKTDPLTHSFVRPNLILEKRNGDKIGKLIYEDLNFNLSGKGVNEFSITVHKNNDGIECSFWNSIKDLAIINWQGFGRFVIDIQVDESNETTKVINCISLEGDELAQPIIRNLHINDKEAMTTLDPGDTFKPTYLYVIGDPTHSLLDRIINAKTKHWQIGHVDTYFNVNGRVYKACNLQREFTIDGKSPYDVLEQEVAKECGCIFTYDTYNRIVNCYNAVECVFNTETMEVLDDIFYDLDTQGYYTYDANNVKIPVSGNYEYCDGIGSDTTIIFTRERLSENVTVNSDKDSIKNCFYVTGGDEVITNYVASANASGSNYIYNFDYQYDLMSDALVQRLKSYKEYYKQKEIEYNKIGGVYVYDPNVTYDSTKGCYIDNHGKIIIDDNVRIVNNRICVLSPYSYYEDGECYNEDGTVITTTHTYDEPGLFIKFCQANDRLAYWDHNKFPNMTPENTTAEAELQKIKTYFQSNPLIITNAAGINSFAHVSLLIKDICNVITDNRYSVTVDNTTTSCDQINDSQGKTTGYWEGKISVARDADKEDYDEDTIRILVKKSQNGAEDKDYCDQKIKIAMAKMDISELPLTYNMSTTDDDNELREMFSQYNLTSLKGFRDSFDGCLSVLDDLQNQMLSTDDERQGFISRAFEQAFRIYKNRYNICVEYSGKSATERTSDTTVIGITEATVNKWTSVVDDYTNQIIEFQKQLSLETYLGNLYTEFLSFVREDEYNNGNYNSDGLSDSELLYKANELREVANAELRKASQIHYTLNGTINNIFNIDELKVIKDNFEIFNYVRYIADGRIFKLRLLGISGDENSLDTISVTFSDVISVTDMPGEEVKKQLDTAQAMSTTYSSTTLQARQGSSAYSSVDKMKTEGLNSAEYIIKNSNAEVIHDDHGSLYKNMDDTSVFSDNQLRITPAGMYLTDDAWQTTGMAVGTVIMTNPSTGLKQKYFGVIADYIYGTLLAGNGLEIANENGSVNITGDGIELDGGSITWKTKLPQSSVTDLVDDLAEITSEISELDDRIETFSQTTDPSADWTTTELKEKHLSDLWFNPTDGLTKRWTKSGTTYKWETVTDSDLVALAQSKATVFVSKPTSGYRAKDLWILEKDNSDGSDTTYPSYKKGSVLVASTTSSTYNTESKNHWKEDVRYTDDTTANQALADARQGIADAAGALARANAVDIAAQGYADTAESNAKNASDPRGSASSAEANAKGYADTKDTALSATLTAAYQNYVGSAVGNLDHAVADYLNLSGATSIYTAEYAISPYIGGGYVNVSKGSGRVIIDPSNQAGTGYILAGMKTSGTDQGIKFGIDSNGNAVFTGAITATSLTLGTGVTIGASKVSGLSTVATSGNYSDLSGKPSIPSELSDLTDGANVMHFSDITFGTPSTDPNTGITTQTVSYKDSSGVSHSYTEKYSADGKYILTDIGKGTGSWSESTDIDDHQNNYFLVSTDGLLKANNAIIYGDIYATNGYFSGTLSATKGTIGGWTINSSFLGSYRDIDEDHTIAFELVPGLSRIQITYTDTTSSLDDQHITSYLTYNGLFFENDLLGNDSRVSYRNDGLYYYNNPVIFLSGQSLPSINVGYVDASENISAKNMYATNFSGDHMDINNDNIASVDCISNAQAQFNVKCTYASVNRIGRLVMDPIYNGRFGLYVENTGWILYNDAARPNIVCTDKYINSQQCVIASTTATPNCYIDTNGTFLRTSGSSMRFKEEISECLSDEIDPKKLYDINVYSYKFRTDYLKNEKDIRYQKKVVGFIAEDILEKYPIAAEYHKDNNGELIADDWNDRYIIPAMLKLIQEQKQNIDQLQQQIKELQESR